MQVALHELSKRLPQEQRPMPAHLLEVADNNTSALPNTGMDAGHPHTLSPDPSVVALFLHWALTLSDGSFSLGQDGNEDWFRLLLG